MWLESVLGLTCCSTPQGMRMPLNRWDLSLVPTRRLLHSDLSLLRLFGSESTPEFGQSFGQDDVVFFLGGVCGHTMCCCFFLVCVCVLFSLGGVCGHTTMSLQDFWSLVSSRFSGTLQHPTPRLPCNHQLAHTDQRLNAMGQGCLKTQGKRR